eukprot:g13842.t1
MQMAEPASKKQKTMQPPSTLAVPEHLLHLIDLKYDMIDKKASSMLKLISDLDAHQCWHKHGTFGQHLINVWKILITWKQSEAICRMGLFHSTYSNSWVGLALLEPGAERGRLKEWIGAEAEELVHIMCSLPRMTLTFRDCMLKGVPKEGYTVKDIRTGKDLHLSRRIVCIYLLFHVADWAEQFTSWQDKLFRLDRSKGDYVKPFLEIIDGMFDENPGTLWPGDGRPGLIVSFLSQVCKIIKECEEPDLVPPCFENSTKVLAPIDEKVARDAYWEVMTQLTEPEDTKQALEKLKLATEKNPYVGEPFAMLAQVYMREKRWDEAAKACEKAMHVFAVWGTAWDKRISFDGWVSWIRTMHLQATKHTWPSTSMGMISIGLVQDKQPQESNLHSSSTASIMPELNKAIQRKLSQKRDGRTSSATNPGLECLGTISSA